MYARSAYLEFLDYLNSVNVRYAVLHGSELLVQGKASEIDFVVAKDDLKKLEAALCRRYRILTVLHYEASSFGFVLGARDCDRTSFFIVDFTTDYRWKGRIFFTDEELLQERWLWSGFWLVGARQEFGYLLVKKIYEKGSVPEHQRSRLKELATGLGQSAYSVALKLFGKEWGSQVINWIFEGRWAELEASIKPLGCSLRWQVVKSDPLNPLRYWLAELGRMWQRWNHSTGMLVAVLGPDGAGKSTLIEDLKVNLFGPFRRTAVFHLRPGIMGRKDANGPVSNPHAKTPYPLWLSLLKVPYYFLDYSLGYLIKLRLKLVRSTLVLFDRYYDDLLVDPRRYRYGGPVWIARLACSFIPKPDLFLILDVPDDQLMARKQEVCLEELSRQRRGYRQLAKQLSNAFLLDGSLPQKEVTRNASETILDYLHARYIKRRHLWFHDTGWETLYWLESVLFSSGKSGLARSGIAEDGLQVQWPANGSFRWLDVKDGRGYLIPEDSCRHAVNALRLYNAQNLKAKIAKKLLTAGLGAGVAWPLLRKVRVLNRGHLSENEKRKISLLEHLKEILQYRDVSFAISLGTPGPHRKPVIQVIKRDGQIAGYVKIGWNDATNALVRNEAGVFQRLANASFHSFTAPSVLYSGWWGDQFLFIQSAPDGRIQSPPQRLVSQYLAVLKELAAFHIRWIPLRENAFWKNLLQRIESIQSAYYRHILQQGACRVEEWLVNTPLPFHFCHGDFAPWNAQLLNGRLFLFDWEYAAFEGPPLWDLFHFTFQTLWLLEKRTPGEMHQAVLKRGMQTENIRMYLESLNIRESHLRSLFSVYLLDRLAFYASDYDADQRTLRYFANVSSLIMSDEKSSQ